MVITDEALMASPRSFRDIVLATARQKLVAAQARNNPNLMAEKPRAAIFEALHIIGNAIALDGFVLVHSGPKFTRRNGDFTFEIRFQSDRNNVAGQRAAVWVHVAVYSKSLTAWRKKHSSEWIRPKTPFPLSLFGTQLGYLCNPSAWEEWDVADKAKRGLLAEQLIASIRAGAYQLFSTFGGPIEGIAAISDHDWPPPEGVLSYLLSSGHSTLATETLRDYLDKHPDFCCQFEPLYQKFTEHGLPTFRTAMPHDLAAFAVASGYPWS